MSRLERLDRKEAKRNREQARKRDRKTSRKLIRQNGLTNLAGTLFGGFDYAVLIMVFVLSIFGMAMVFSAGYYTTVSEEAGPLFYLRRQAMWVFSGFLIMAWVAHYDYHKYSKFANALMAISIGLLIAVLLVGQTINGATRWLGIGSFRITPSEFSKVFMIIFTSCYLVANPNAVKEREGLLVLTVVMIAHVGLIIKQPNLSTAIVIALIMVAIVFVAGLDYKYIGVLIGAFAVGLFVILNFMKDSHWYARLTNWIDPFADAQGEGYQVSQSIIALGNGGLKGLGFGKSISKNLYLPEPTNDFILAIIGEELGYIGFLFLMIAYIFLLFRLILIALRAKDSLGFYLATGVAVMLGLQVIINVAVVTASMPATGITLPFISYGGASIWAFMMAMGIALNVSRKERPRGNTR